jgi:hypothetical protein
MFPSKNLCLLLLAAGTLIPGARGGASFAGQRRQKKTAPQTSAEKSPSPPASVASQEPQTEKVEVPSAPTSPPATLTSEAGSLRPEEMAALLKNMRFSEYRINDLLTDVKPERWKLPEATLNSFNETLKTLRSAVEALEQWRAQLSQRPDSIYLGFQTYAAIDAVLPRLYGVASSVAEHENSSYAAQVSQAGGQLFDLQQKLGSYVGSLLHFQDQQIVALDNNLAACQQTLGAEMRGKTPRATPMKNVRMGRPQRRSSHPLSTGAVSGRNKSAEKKSTPPTSQEQKKP